MPRMPELNTQTQMERAPPGGDVTDRNATQLAQSQSDLGSSLQKLGGITMELASRRKDADDKNYAFEKSNEDRMAINDYMMKAQSQYERDVAEKGAANVGSFKESLQGFITERQQSSWDAAPSDSARDLYKRSTQDDYINMFAKAESYEHRTKAAYYKTGILESANNMSKMFYDNPDPKSAQLELMRQETYIDSNIGNVFSLEEAQQEKEKLRNTFALQTAEGLLDKKMYGQGRQYMAVKDGAAKQAVFDHLTPGQRANYLDKFNHGVELTNEVKTAQVNRDVNFFSIANRSGQPPGEQARSSLINKIKSSNMSPMDKNVKIAEVNFDHINGKISEKISSIPTKDVQNFKPDMEKYAKELMDKDIVQDKGINTPEWETAKKALGFKAEVDLEQIIAQDLKQRQDSVKYLIDKVPEAKEAYEKQLGGDPAETSNYLALIESQQKKLGLGNQILPDDRLKQLGSMLSAKTDQNGNSINPAGKIQLIQRIKNQYGDAAPRVFGSMIDKGALRGEDIQMGYALYFDDEIAQAAIIGNVHNDGIKDKLKNMPRADKDDLEIEVSEAIKDPLVAVSRGGNESLGKAFRDLVTYQAIKLQSDTPSMSNRDAATEASKLIKDQFNTVVVGGSSVIAPKTSDGKFIHPKNISNFLDAHQYSGKYEELDKEMNFFVPPKYEGKRDRFYADLSSHGYWVTDGDGLTLKIKNRTNATDIVRDVNNNKIHMPFSKIEGNIKYRTRPAYNPDIHEIPNVPGGL